MTGIDQSPHFIDVASGSPTRTVSPTASSFAVGDVHGLDLPAASFDAVVAHTLISHVHDPLKVLAEAARVRPPGGAVAVFDGDYASLTFGCSDPESAS